MEYADIFNNPAFKVANLTDAINVIPNMYGRLNQLGMFPARGVSTDTVMVEYNNGVLNLLPRTYRTGPAAKNTSGSRNVRSFVIPQFAVEDTIHAADVQGIRAFGSNQTQTVAAKVAEKLAEMRNKQAITLEYMRAGALAGVIKDGNGATLVNLFTEFGISEKVVDFDFGVATTDIREKCFEVSRYIEDNLTGEVMSGVHALCSPEFFSALVSHPTVKEAYLNSISNRELRVDNRKGFLFTDIWFEEYRGKADDLSGSAQNFIETGSARFFPRGTQNTFRTYYAPADFSETVNTLGRELYAKMEPIKFDRGQELHVQSNPLPICARPALLVKGTIT